MGSAENGLVAETDLMVAGTAGIVLCSAEIGLGAEPLRNTETSLGLKLLLRC